MDDSRFTRTGDDLGHWCVHPRHLPTPCLGVCTQCMTRCGAGYVFSGTWDDAKEMMRLVYVMNCRAGHQLVSEHQMSETGTENDRSDK